MEQSLTLPITYEISRVEDSDKFNTKGKKGIIP